MRQLVIDRSSNVTLIAYDGRTLALDGRDDTWVARLRDFMQGERPDALAVGLGPGSFAGIRATIATLQGLGIAWNLKPRGFPSAALWAVASGLPEVTVVGDARRNTLWTVRYQVTPERIEQRGGFELRRRENFVPEPSMVSPDAGRLATFGLRTAKLSASILESTVARLEHQLTDDPKPIYLHPAVGVTNAQ